MRVLQINATYSAGSTGNIVKSIHELLSEKGDSFVAYQTYSEIPDHGYKIGNFIDWKFHALYTRIIGRQAYASKASTKRFLKWVDSIKPDIIHMHNLHSNYINLNLLLKYCAEKNIKTIVSLHDCWFFTGKCFHFDACGCERWKQKCGQCIQKREPIKSFFFDCTRRSLIDKHNYFQAIDNLTIVGCSNWISNLARESFVFKDRNIVTIYNGVDTNIFNSSYRDTERKLRGYANKFVILGMANKWFQKKNRNVVEKILYSLNENEIIIIVGCSAKQINELGGNKKIIPIGYLNDKTELAKIYSISDVFVNLTFEDTLPTVNMEAICCGTPVITYNSCGSSELINEGVTGFIVDKLDVEGIKHAISKIKEGIIRRDVCIEIGSSIFDKNKRYEEYINLYQKTIGMK